MSMQLVDLLVGAVGGMAITIVGNLATERLSRWLRDRGRKGAQARAERDRELVALAMEFKLNPVALQHYLWSTFLLVLRRALLLSLYVVTAIALIAYAAYAGFIGEPTDLLTTLVLTFTVVSATFGGFATGRLIWLDLDRASAILQIVRKEGTVQH